MDVTTPGVDMSIRTMSGGSASRSRYGITDSRDGSYRNPVRPRIPALTNDVSNYPGPVRHSRLRVEHEPPVLSPVQKRRRDLTRGEGGPPHLR